MEENQNVIYKASAQCGLSSGTVELYSNRLVFVSSKGKTNIYEYSDIANVKDTMGCLEITTISGKFDTFAIDKDLRLKMIEYMNNNTIIQENNKKVQPTQNTNVSQEPAVNFKDIQNDLKGFKNLNEDKKNMYIGLAFVVGVIIVVIMIIGGIFGGNISSSSKQKDYIKEAVENLSNVNTHAPVTSLNSAKIIKYGNDILVAISYNVTDIYR